MSNGLADWNSSLFPALFFSSRPFLFPLSSFLSSLPSILPIHFYHLFLLQTNQLIPNFREYLITTSNMSQQVAEVAKILQEQGVDLVEYGHQLQFRFGNSAATSKV